MKRKPFTMAFDGVESAQAILDKIAEAFARPREIVDYIGYLKFNDALHLEGMKGDDGVLAKIVSRYPINIFWDLKLPDTNGTDKNILLKYVMFMRPGDILTMTSDSSLRAFREVRSLIPEGVKIAIVSVKTDTDFDECRMRRGATPGMAILNDATNLLEFGTNLFDAVVCSSKELKILKQNLPDYIEIHVPGIRDWWMDIGQQSADRIDGIKNILDAGADNLILGGQLFKGNPGKGISPAKSRKLSIAEALKSDALSLIKGQPLETLINLEGHYQSSKGPDGNFLGPLVAYSGKYPSPTGEKNYVGDVYFNLAMIEDHPQRLNYFAKLMVKKIRAFEETWGHKIDCLIGAPEGGSKIAQEVGRLLNIPGLRLEKEVTALKTATAKEEFNLVMRRNAGALQIGWFALIFEDLCNNFGTTQKGINTLDTFGVVTVGIACVANRSKDHIDEWEGLPVIAGMSVPSEQYEQEDPLVSDLIAAGSLSTDPKKDWSKLKA